MAGFGACEVGVRLLGAPVGTGAAVGGTAAPQGCWGAHCSCCFKYRSSSSPLQHSKTGHFGHFSVFSVISFLSNLALLMKCP